MNRLARLLLTNVTLESDGVYYATVQIQRQDFKVILDTGSPVLAIPGSDCVSCGDAHSRWNASLNSSAYRIRYAEGSYIDFNYVYDTITLDRNVVLENYPIGVIRNESKLFRKQEADGIFGLYGDFIETVGAFSMCFRTREFDVGLPSKGEFTWIPIKSNSFSLDLDSVAGLDARGYRAHIDSGTTDILLPKRYISSRTRNGGLCTFQFKGQPITTLDRCIPSERIIASSDDSFVFGTSFFKHVPQLVFTQSHVGLGWERECVPYEPPTYVAGAQEKWSALGVIASYVVSVVWCLKTFSIHK
jgi:hypothetical protein